MVDQLGSYDRDDLRREGFDRFDDRDRFDNSQRDQAFERAREQDMREMEQDRLILEQDNAIVRILMDIINDPEVVMDENGNLNTVFAGTKLPTIPPRTPMRRRPMPTGRDVIRRSGQFSRANILPPLPKPRKKNKKHCKNLSQCFRQANAKLRLKNGQLRKGKTQSDVAKMAHRLLKKMK